MGRAVLFVYSSNKYYLVNLLDLSNKGAGALGGVVGAAIGMLGGPAGSLAGAAAGSVIGDVLKDVASRQLSHREQVRLDNATVYIADGIVESLDAGRIVRQDGFFDGDTNFSSNGYELLEGVLLKCKAQYQEKKVKLLANLFKNVAFDAAIKANTAYQMLNLADGLTYFDLCVVSYYGRNQKPKIILPITRFGYYDNLGLDTLSAINDLFRMCQLGLLHQNNLSSPLNQAPIDCIIDKRGEGLFTLLELEHLPESDVLEAMKPFEYKAHWMGPESRP